MYLTHALLKKFVMSNIVEYIFAFKKKKKKINFVAFWDVISYLFLVKFRCAYEPEFDLSAYFS